MYNVGYLSVKLHNKHIQFLKKHYFATTTLVVNES